MRPVLRFVASVMMVSGVLLIADAGATLLWEEPVSAFVAERQQVQLEEQVQKQIADPAAPATKRVLRREPLPGDAVGKLEIPAIGASEYIVEGTDTANLRKGPGHYPETPLPGGRGTVAVAGHRTTYGAPFRDLDDVKPGDRIVFDTLYGRFIYRVEENRIVDDSDLSVLEPVGYKQLILTACHPLYSAAQRIVVFAKQVKRERSRVRRAS